MTIRLLIPVLIFSACKTQYQPLFTAEEMQQAQNYPFEILYAESCETDDGTELSDYQRLQRNDVLTLKDGYLLLAHFGGELLEFEGDTTLYLDLLQRHRDSIEYDEIFTSRFLVDLLEPVSYSLTLGSIHNYGGIYFMNDLPLVNTITPDESLCLSWTNASDDGENMTYRVQVLNHYQVAVFEEETDENSIKLELKDLNFRIDHFGNDPGWSPSFFVVEVSTLSDPDHVAEIGFEMKEGAERLNTCLSKKPIEHLRQGLYYERVRHFELAHFEYKKAAELCDRKIYRELYTNFTRRPHLK